MNSITYQNETIQVSPLVITHMEYQEEQLHIVTTENCQVRAERDEALDDNYRLREENRRLREQLDRWIFLFDWTRKLFANKTIPTAACKLVLWYYYTTFFFMRPEATGEEMRFCVQDTAKVLGISEDTVRNSTKKAETWDILQRREEKTTNENGEPRTLIHITLEECINHPEDIRMEKVQGGARQKKCPKCNSHDVDRYTVQYCRECDTNAWYGQPGLREDADVTKAHHASNMPLYTGKKQDAFDMPADESEQITTISERIDTAIATTQHLASSYHQEQAEQKQDALEQNIISDPQGAAPESIHINTPEQLATEHSISITAASSPVCHAQVLLNKEGKPAHALEKVIAYQECGSHRWQWSQDDHVYICTACWTPQTRLI